MPLKIYTFLLRLVAPLLWAYMFVRARRAGGDWQIFSAERFGFYALPWDGEAPVWVHAVSLGETRAAQTLIKQLLARGERVLLTHMTATGRAEGARLFAAEIAAGQLRQQWVPYDFSGATKKFMQHYRPRLGILIEREVWPNLIEHAQLAAVPIVLASARFSEKSQKQVKQIDKVFLTLMRDAYAGIDLTLAQTEDDATRLYEVGALNIHVVGNLKFDVTPPRDINKKSATLKKHLHLKNQSVLLIASSRQDEEEMILQSLLKLPIKNLITIFVPRHPQRFKEVELMLKKYRVSFIKRSDKKIKLKTYQFILGDSMGEMYSYYNLANIALMGGTILPYGGQNLIESMAMNVPVILGPHTYNFHDVSNEAIRLGAATRIQTLDQLEKVLPQMLRSSSQSKMKKACHTQQNRAVGFKRRGVDFGLGIGLPAGRH